MAVLPGVWAPWEWAASASPGGRPRGELRAAFFPEHSLTTSAALTCYMSLCPPEPGDEGTQDQRWAVFLGRMYIFLRNF